MHKSQMSIYLSKLKGLLNKQLHKDKMNGIDRLCMQLHYMWLNSFVHKNKLSTVHEFTKIERLTGKLA